jgi:predicted nucleic acid-binding protein
LTGYVDTSVLAACYLPEPKSAAANRLVAGLDAPAISALTEVELCSVLSRRVREKELSLGDGQRVLALFRSHIAGGFFRLLPLDGRDFRQARDWLSRFSTSLRTLDALHLAVAVSNGLTLITADRPFARAARKLGATVTVI